jgi:O-succinylhomoserine sulfhydrylase
MTNPNPLPETAGLETLLVHGGGLRSQHLETSEAIYMSSGYVYGSAAEAEAAFTNDGSRYVYSRYANPTLSMFEERLRLLEGAEACRATASGMAAVFAALACQVKAGDRVVASRALFGSCLHIINNILPRWGVRTELVDGRDLDQWRRKLAEPVKAVFVETPSNPTLDLVDIAAVAALTHRAGGLLIIDNVFATPILQKPLALGADIVVYSATKHIDGQGRSLGGAILGSRSFIGTDLSPFLRHTGPALSPFNAWIMVKGLETLPLRVQQHCRNAQEVAAFLDKHPKVVRALYPGLESHPQYALARRQMTGSGNLVAFIVAGGKAGAFRFQDALRIVKISNNLGDAKSLITHPATTTHQKLSAEEKQALGIDEALVRLSVGLENVGDLVEDLDRALRSV